MQAVGGVWYDALGRYEFPFDAYDTIGELLASGSIPDRVAYQYYPTPDSLAEAAVAEAEIGPEHHCLEPSAGQGALLAHMPAGQTDCIEASSLNCRVLEAKGHDPPCSDFLEYGGKQYDRLVMNPPFNLRQAQAHIEHAGSLLASGGRLVSIVPAGFNDADILPGMTVKRSPVYDNQFEGTSISVALLICDRHV